MEIVGLSALHDADDDKLFQMREYLECWYVSRRDLYSSKPNRSDLPGYQCCFFQQNLGKHPETIEGKIVQDADRLDAIEPELRESRYTKGGHLLILIQHFHDKLSS